MRAWTKNRPFFRSLFNPGRVRAQVLVTSRTLPICRSGRGLARCSVGLAWPLLPVSILQTWTYSPQKRQDGSAFALTYRLLLRSCKLMGGFVISPLPPFFVRAITNSRASSLHGHYSASSLIQTRPNPSRLPPTSRCHRLYGFPVPPISQRGEEGFSSCLA